MFLLPKINPIFHSRYVLLRHHAHLVIITSRLGCLIFVFRVVDNAGKGSLFGETERRLYGERKVENHQSISNIRPPIHLHTCPTLTIHLYGIPHQMHDIFLQLQVESILRPGCIVSAPLLLVEDEAGSHDSLRRRWLKQINCSVYNSSPVDQLTHDDSSTHRQSTCTVVTIHPIISSPRQTFSLMWGASSHMSKPSPTVRYITNVVIRHPTVLSLLSPINYPIC